MMYLSRLTKHSFINICRRFSVTSKKVEIANVGTNLINVEGKNSIIVSQSRDIFENLALEDWLYTNCDLSATNSSILLMWNNTKAVVIGRHQNPWIECSEDFCTTNGIKIARRNSGGGTVYHDFGNLNFSFLTSRQNYDRKKNLELICESINRKWGLNLSISKRHDILYNDQYKISGTASKLGRKNAYHHCTVLVHVDEYKLHQALHRELEGVESKATSSIRAEVVNLRSVCTDVDTDKVMEAVKSNYKQLYEVTDDHLFCIQPSEHTFPGINQIIDGLKSWEWRFGHTPKFTLTKTFQIDAKNPSSNVQITMNINKGLIEAISLEPQILSDESFDALKKCIVNTRFSHLIHSSLYTWIVTCFRHKDKVLCRTVQHYIYQMVSDLLK